MEVFYECRSLSRIQNEKIDIMPIPATTKLVQHKQGDRRNEEQSEMVNISSLQTLANKWITRLSMERKNIAISTTKRGYLNRAQVESRQGTRVFNANQIEKANKYASQIQNGVIAFEFEKIQYMDRLLELYFVE